MIYAALDPENFEDDKIAKLVEVSSVTYLFDIIIISCALHLPGLTYIRIKCPQLRLKLKIKDILFASSQQC